MTKKKKNKIIGIVSLCLAVAVVVVMSAVGVSKAFGLNGPINFTGAIENVSIDVAGADEEVSLGGSTSDDWNVGGALNVTGATTFSGALSVTGATTLSSTLGVTGETSLGRVNMGGSVYSGTTTPSAALTLVAADICDNSYIGLTPSAAINVTLPATSTLFADCLTANGDYVDILVGNEGAAASTTTIVAGTGIDLQEPDGQNVVIAGDNYAQLRIMRISATEAVAIVDETIPAD